MQRAVVACRSRLCSTSLHPLPNPLSDVQGSQAYAKALAKAGVLTQEEADTIVEGLSKCVAAHCCLGLI